MKQSRGISRMIRAPLAAAAMLLLLSVTAVMFTGAEAPALQPGASGAGDGPAVTPPGTTVTVDNGGVWGVMSHRSDAMRAHSSARNHTILKESDSAFAASGFDRLAVVTARIGMIYSDVPPPGIAPINVDVFNRQPVYDPACLPGNAPNVTCVNTTSPSAAGDADGDGTPDNTDVMSCTGMCASVIEPASGQRVCAACTPDTCPVCSPISDGSGGWMCDSAVSTPVSCAAQTDAAGRPLMRGFIYNKFANIGFNHKGMPNTLAVALSNTMENMLDSYYGNMGGLQRLGVPGGNTLQVTGGSAMSTGVTVGPGVEGMAQGGMNFSGGGAAQMGFNRVGAMTRFSQDLNTFLHGALGTSGADITGNVSGTDLNGDAIEPFSALHDAMDYEYADPGGAQTWAEILRDSIWGPTGSMTQLRVMAGSAPTDAASGIADPMGMDLSYKYCSGSGEGPACVLEDGLPDYYQQLCYVMNAKTAVFNIINSTGLTYIDPDALATDGACEAMAPPRNQPPASIFLTQNYRDTYSGPNGYLASRATSFADASFEDLAAGAVVSGFNRAVYMWAGGANSVNVRLGQSSAQFSGVTRGMEDASYSDMVTVQAGAHAGAQTNAGYKTRMNSAGNRMATRNAWNDKDQVLRTPPRVNDTYDNNKPPKTPLTTWKPAPDLVAGASVSAVVGVMPP